MPPRWRAWRRRLQAEHGRVDILVNSAGINFPRRYWARPSRHLQPGGGHQPQRRDGLHAGGTAGHARAAQGTVINVASFAGWHYGYLTGPAYTASKAALIALTHAFNIEEGVNGLRATSLCPARWPRRSC